ncbi:MAG: hypothetical protein QOD92_4203 [Acidimicrobiaceae bacterium]|jgi:hypothetical protein
MADEDAVQADQVARGQEAIDFVGDLTRPDKPNAAAAPSVPPPTLTEFGIPAGPIDEQKLSKEQKAKLEKAKVANLGCLADLRYPFLTAALIITFLVASGLGLIVLTRDSDKPVTFAANEGDSSCSQLGARHDGLVLIACDADASASSASTATSGSGASQPTPAPGAGTRAYEGTFTKFEGTSPEGLTSNKVTVNSINFVVRDDTVDVILRYTIRIEEGDPSGLEPSCFVLDLPSTTLPVAAGTADGFTIDGADIPVVTGGSPGETSCAPGTGYNSEGVTVSQLSVVREAATSPLTGSVTLEDGTIMRFEAQPSG